VVAALTTVHLSKSGLQDLKSSVCSFSLQFLFHLVPCSKYTKQTNVTNDTNIYKHGRHGPMQTNWTSLQGYLAGQFHFPVARRSCLILVAVSAEELRVLIRRRITRVLNLSRRYFSWKAWWANVRLQRARTPQECTGRYGRNGAIWLQTPGKWHPKGHWLIVQLPWPWSMYLGSAVSHGVT
jgi:hypothetical protein